MKVLKSLLYAYLLTGFLTGAALCIGSLSGSLALHLWDTSATNPGFWAYPLIIVYAMVLWGPAVVRSVMALFGFYTGVEVLPIACIVLTTVFILLFLFFLRREKRKNK